MTEQQPYRVVARHPRFELRRYPAHLVAEMRVRGSFDAAAGEAFRPLAAYLKGANRSRHGIAMTAPVVQEAAPETIAMTAPVVQEEGDRPDSWLVRFVMPAGFTVDTLPEPTDPRVRTREVPDQLVAAMRFSGRGTAAAFDRQATALGRAITGVGLRPAGAIRYARFDPPWKPWFLRRNEVLLPVDE
ncbi:SOUL family heme-binding protein [Micromonospora endolithica]|uniref:Heme-binding protein n=1 Tax=Micromonospora endolithica TaxID=230091 RepID=A0A3A9ZMM2_9ACTN|nr:heme-binding protein [Micromonospora endolithica]RKN49561.1 heme-binding protein [Micromonospora endolithica]TWJ23778.1 SOUL heme-binding protein [Micromonospora endolithica]